MTYLAPSPILGSQDWTSLGMHTAVRKRKSLGLKAKCLCAATLVWIAALSLDAEELRFDEASEWGKWSLPLGIVELTPEGVIRPLPVRKNINAALRVGDYGGGIRGVGSNPNNAPLVFDGDPATGWGPAPGELAERGWIEVDLGRGVPASAVSLVFAAEAPPFEIFDLLLSTGEQFRDEARVPVPGSLTYRIVRRFGQNDAHLVEFAIPAIPPTPIQFLRFEALKASADSRLVEIAVEALGDNLVSNLREKGGAVEIIVGTSQTNTVTATLGNAMRLIDGRVNTYWITGRDTRAPEDVWAWITLDLGATYWVDQIHHIGVIDRGRGFNINYQEMLTSDGGIASDGSLRWTRHFSGVLPRAIRNQGMVAHHFGPIPVRFVRIRFKAWDAHCGDEFGQELARGCSSNGQTSEIMVFGEGFPREVRFRSPILALEGAKNVHALRWAADVPPDTRFELRSRSGNELEENLIFYDKNQKEVTAKRWDKLIPSFRGPIDTTLTPGGDWSPWSNIYASSGGPFLSPSLRRFVQLEARLISDSPQRAPSLDWVSLDFADPIADRVVAEIYPHQAEPGARVIFSYWLRASSTRQGFDRVDIEASTPLHFNEILVDGVPIEVKTQSDSLGFDLHLQRRVQSDELLEIRFEAAIFLQATRFDLFITNSDLDPDVRQQVESGDANPLVESNTNVVELPQEGALFADFSVQPKVLTPNGDGIGDRLVIKLALINVLEPRSLNLDFFDLAGRRIRRIAAEVRAGDQELFWDGRDQFGRLVPPGHYIMRIGIESDARSQALCRLVQTVY